METANLESLMRILEGDHAKKLKATGITTSAELIEMFIENKKFVRYKNDQIKAIALANFNYLIAERLYWAKCISKKQFELQRSMFSYNIRGWTFGTLKKYNVNSLGEAKDRCIEKDGSFIPLGGNNKAVASNYEIAKILHREGFLSEKQFLLVVRPQYKYRQLTGSELEGTADISIEINRWPEVTQQLIVILYHRRRCVSWARYANRKQKLQSISLQFLAKEFLRVPPYGDIPEFKATGFYLHKLFEAEWIENLEDSLSVVKHTLRKHLLLV